jgi:hypothetical protein
MDGRDLGAIKTQSPGDMVNRLGTCARVGEKAGPLRR